VRFVQLNFGCFACHSYVTRNGCRNRFRAPVALGSSLTHQRGVQVIHGRDAGAMIGHAVPGIRVSHQHVLKA
jgi:hypothetical protein